MENSSYKPVKCKECLYSEKHFFRGKGWCNKDQKMVEPESPICHFAHDEFIKKEEE